MLRRVRENMHELGAYMHRAETASRDTAPTPRERLVYEGQVAVNFFEARPRLHHAGQRDGPRRSGRRHRHHARREREDGWLPDIDVKARIIVEILE
jgi:hypothetical protein